MSTTCCAASTFTICHNKCTFFSIQHALDHPEVQPGSVLILRDKIHTESGIVIDKNITIQGDIELDHPIIQAAETPDTAQNRIFTIQQNAIVAFKNLTLRYGRAPRTYPPSGGAICNYGTLTLESCVLTRNRATDGGAVLNKGRLTIADSRFTENTADGMHPDMGLRCGSGGAIKAETGELTVSHSVFQQNSASEKGGGLYIACKTNATITTSRITQNTAPESGAGIHVRGKLQLTDTTIEHNQSTGLGGGLFIHGEVAFSRNILRDNTRYDCYLVTEHPYKEAGAIMENHDNIIADQSCPPE